MVNPKIRKYKGGFTLVELLAVIGIILVLAAIAIPAISNAIQAGERASDARSVQVLNSSYQNYLAAGGTPQSGTTDVDTVLNALAATEVPNAKIGVGGPFILTRPTGTPQYSANGSLTFNGTKFYWANASQSSNGTL